MRLLVVLSAALVVAGCGAGRESGGNAGSSIKGSTTAEPRVERCVERFFAQEFPSFAPYPWGAKRWIAGHIRHVMFAEAMVDDFANAFQGVTPADAEALADAFALENCLVRERLADTLRQAALAGG